jgi:prepilin-type N-terminal cleavage/methylation domain-containing protein
MWRLIKAEKHIRPGCRTPRGFTLLEILIAMALLAIAITVLVELFSTNLRNIATSQNYIPAVVAAETMMSNVLSRDLIDETVTNIKTDEGYRIDVVVSEALRERMQSLPIKLLDIQVTVRWTMDQKEKMFRLHSYKTVPRQGFEEKTEDKTKEKPVPKNENSHK